MSDKAGALRVETIGRFDATVGEGPVWLSTTAEVLWIDMPAGKIHRTRLDTGATSTLTLDTFVGSVVPRASGGYVAATKTGFAFIDQDGTHHSGPVILDQAKRMNDGKCDPTGRFWAGSTDMEFAPEGGALHVLEAGGRSRVILEGLTLPNGMGWSPTGDLYYLADSVAGVVWVFTVDLYTCELSNQRELLRFDADEGMPDGLCVDAVGCVWIALWGGGRVVRISPDGDRLQEVRLPALQTSSCAFGGSELSDLVVTSARTGLTGGLDDGALFAVRGLNTHGLPTSLFAG